MQSSFAIPSRVLSFAAAFGLLCVAQAASAGPNWQLTSFATTPANAPQVVAATDTLLSSPTGKQFPGKVLLLQQVANGADPSTHMYVSLYKTVAAREAFERKLEKDPAWTVFLDTLTKLSQPVAQVRHATLKSWGDIADSDVVWYGYAFKVRDGAAFVAALDKFMASEKVKKFPGQVHLSAVDAGGPSPVTHTISVGFASEAEAETWNDSLAGNADWTTYLDASNASSEYLGANLSRTLKQWGPASLADVSPKSGK